MSRWTQVIEHENGWSDWISPKARYVMVCCDCGLAHNLQFKIHAVEWRRGSDWKRGRRMTNKEAWVLFRAGRNQKETRLARRKKK